MNAQTGVGILAGLALQDDASPEELAEARDHVAEFLDSAPPELTAWAAAQVRRLDEAVDHLRDAPVPPTDGPTDTGSIRTGSRWARPARLILLPLLIVGIVVGIYLSDGLRDDAPSGETASDTGAGTEQMGGPAADATVDAKRVAELRARLADEPRNIDVMRQLGETYYAGGDFAAAGRWQERILDLRPDDVDALLALGVARFNDGDLTAAEEQWQRALEIAPDTAEVHYNLGFLYLSQDPPDSARAEAEWDEVLRLAPESDMAQTIRSHMERGVTGDKPAGGEQP